MITLEQDPILLGALETAIKKKQESFFQVFQTIKNEEVSNYPILVAYPNTTNVEIGLPIVEGERYNFNATTLEELAMKKIVNLKKVDEFRKLYKDKPQNFCVFFIELPTPQFIFVPY